MDKKCSTCIHLDEAHRCRLISRPRDEGNNHSSLAYTTDDDSYSSYLNIVDPDKFYCYHWTKEETNGEDQTRTD